MPPVRAPIERITVRHLSMPIDPPFRAAVVTVRAVELVFVEVDADGLSGIGWAFAFDGASARAVALLALELGAELRGRDALSVAAVHRFLSARLALVGTGGPAGAVMSMVDVALWDLLGKAAGLPLHRVLGGAREEVPAYGSGGSLDLDEAALAAEMAAHARAGLGAVKMKLAGELARDLPRIAAVRGAIGDGLRLVLDANQRYSVPEAVRAARAFAETGANLWWLEEPLPADDVAGLAEVRRAAPLAIATGETNFGTAPFAALLAARAADILMPNVQRAGGITPWLRIAEGAALAGVPVAAHVLPEIEVHLMCGLEGGLVLEYLPWWPSPFEQPFGLAAGTARPPDRPGLGVELDPWHRARTEARVA